jgi:hypothetical protein
MNQNGSGEQKQTNLREIFRRGNRSRKDLLEITN